MKGKLRKQNSYIVFFKTSEDKEKKMKSQENQEKEK